MFFELWLYTRVLGPTPCCKDGNTKRNRLMNLYRHYLLYTLALLVFIISIYLVAGCSDGSGSMFIQAIKHLFAIFFSLTYLVYYTIAHTILSFEC